MEAILFDWSNTLVQFTWDDELLDAGHRAGLAAARSDQDAASFTERYRELVLKDATPNDDYGDLLRELGVDDADAFIDAEHEVWRPAHEALGSAQALLDSLRSRGLKTGLVANSWPDPARLLRADVQAFGLAEQFDVIVFSEEVGFRKPQPEIFLHALERLGVEPENAMFVGDRLETDVQGAARVGMATVQALWFRADDTPGIEPDFMAFTPMDVLNAVRRLAL
ncbi:MAG TPA: HAD-IA family hydrolase [Gaiellaceae bacterium]|jgi:putative hydrolase of the HAD superfamily|nr:HAD-IA family hydrolase [Gaiellaceae bacterium]